jgi:hypothetical protein
VGTFAAIIAAIAGPLAQRFEDVGYQAPGVEFWNTVMRFIIFQLVVMLLIRIRRQNILFNSGKTR